ncbi:3-oxo-5 alpha-steroid delta 4-dehydrogenase alpha 2, putative [Eimeria tenella]|uniref:3-oxo-5 alpha-steroid delta 4-dehydrogenase alpha 2, putative n=1 Tax=Eimeria tenella TaxID=5802 RepID=U6L3T2_EIMTE|nr:3-oxo-5 alpha-steroid delta 4-dehydrogenase alpha 2, putative [Eimeria tenella]CDJ42405.1 3-oxo-5 alpha-steroid delta 4-dehydrogenase alpha 2, putative [Eimeria tenella]|eukprot:XP_013233155.1 3-oxo-5 alpha-steroid delta 4-dehydrogenase alpha 2, putative [Eimeria tenella]
MQAPLGKVSKPHEPPVGPAGAHLGSVDAAGIAFCTYTCCCASVVSVLPRGLFSRLFCAGKLLNLIVVAAFTVHYLHRVFIYSLRHYRFPECRRRDTVPLLLPLSAFMFCFANGLAQSLSGCYFSYAREMRGLRYLFPNWAPQEDSDLELLQKTSLWDTLALLRFAVGLVIFVYGMAVNILADEHLLQLKTVRAQEVAAPHGAAASPANNEGIVTLRRSSRIAAKKDGDNFVTFKYNAHPHGAGLTAYKIPRWGWFKQVSCANYWGEICEWFGFAIMCNSVVALSFAVFTLLFLGRRGVQTHKWYKTRFAGNYPENRRAVIPYVL